MVQRMLDNKNFESKLKNNKSIGIQTGDENERCLTISDTKKIRLYYSKSYKNYILSFDLNDSKKFILTKEKWLLFRKHIEEIDDIMTR
jgi:hypothetical protein